MKVYNKLTSTSEQRKAITDRNDASFKTIIHSDKIL